MKTGVNSQGGQKSMPNMLSPFETPGAALAAQAAKRGRREALAFPDSGGRLDFAAWHEQAAALARGLLARGFGPGDHIALLAENRLEWPVVQLGVALMGGVLVPLNSHYRRDDLGFALRQSDSKSVFLSPSFRSNPYLDMVRDLDGELPLLREVIAFDLPEGFPALLQQGREAQGALPEVEGEAMAALLYTSGTTGTPKGALLSHRAMLANAKEEYAYRIIDPAFVPEERIRPRRTLTVLAAGFASGLGGWTMSHSATFRL